MKVLEFEAKGLLRNRGVATPRGDVAAKAEEAQSIAAALGGPVVLKAQIPSGGRMKAGGVRFAKTPEEARNIAGELLASKTLGYQVERLLVEEKLEIVSELYLAATFDATLRAATFLGSVAGGIDVESAETVVQQSFPSRYPPPHYLGHELAGQLGFRGTQLTGLGKVINELIACFLDWDALLLELNPVILDSQGRWRIADVHLEIDDDALYRQQELLAQIPISAETSGRRSEFERKALQIDSADHRGVAGRLIPLDGNLGLLIGGGGASLTTMDALLDAGLKPANYCEIGGNPSVWKIKELTKLILEQPQVERLAVIMNVVSNTRVDLVARGVIKGVLELGREPRDVIAAFRIPGSWEEEGQALLRHYGIPFFGRQASIDQVVSQIRWPS